MKVGSGRKEGLDKILKRWDRQHRGWLEPVTCEGFKFKKTAGEKPATLQKRSSVTEMLFLEISRTPFLHNTFRWLLLDYAIVSCFTEVRQSFEIHLELLLLYQTLKKR